MATVTIEYYGMEGSGRTLTEAKRDAGAKIERALSGHWTPRMLRVKDWTAFLYREPSGWHYITHQDGASVPDYGPCTHFIGDEKEAKDSALFHLAQNAWNGEEGEAFEALAKGLSKGKRADLFSWAQWQLRFRHAKRHGLTPDQCHKWASEHYDHAAALASVPAA